MRVVEYERYLDTENRLRVWFELEHGQVLKFMVQLECYLNRKWAEVVRYDTAHGFAHCDRLHPYQPATKTKMTTQNYKQALDVAIQDLAKSWSKYRRRYEEWLKQK